MNKAGSKKKPVSENGPERFMSVVYVLAREFGIDEFPQVYHYVELLGDAVNRHVFEQHHKMSPQKKVHNDRRRFIAIFKTRYQQFLDLEYAKKVTPVDAKLINQANRGLLKEGFTPDEYLTWVFDTFLVDNPNFSPPTIKSLCSQFILHSFFTENKELREAKKRQERQKKEGLDLIQRARGLLREALSEADEKKVRKAVKDYSSRDIMLSEFRKVVEKLEATHRQKGQSKEAEDGKERKEN